MRARPLAWGLIAYGLLGLLLVIGGAVIGLDVGGRIERLASSADGTLTAAARSTRAAADSFASIDGSLSEAQAAASRKPSPSPCRVARSSCQMALPVPLAEHSTPD